MTYYELLQVRNDADTEVIRAAYKALMQKFHPDRQPEATGSADMAKLLTAAYTTLSEPRLRATYDERVRQSAMRGLVTRSVFLARTSSSYDDSAYDMPRSRRAGGALLLGAAALVAVTVAATLGLSRHQDATERETAAALQLRPSTELIRRETTIIALVPDKLVLTWPKDDPYASSQVVVIPEIRVEMARSRLDAFKAYVQANQADLAQALATELPKELRGFRLDPEGSGELLLARAMHHSFNRHHPEPVENLCPPDAVNVPTDCSGIVRIHFPKSFWVASTKD